jgi:hypothetical protein
MEATVEALQQENGTLRQTVEALYRENMRLVKRIEVAETDKSAVMEENMKILDSHRYVKDLLFVSERRLEWQNLRYGLSTYLTVLLAIVGLIVLTGVGTMALWPILGIAGGLGAAWLLIYEGFKTHKGFGASVCLLATGFILLFEFVLVMAAMLK